MSFKDEIEKVALHLAKKAILNDTPYAESIDAFKELRSYYAMVIKADPPREDEDVNSFDGFQRAVQNAEERTNGAPIRSRRGNS